MFFLVYFLYELFNFYISLYLCCDSPTVFRFIISVLNYPAVVFFVWLIFSVLLLVIVSSTFSQSSFNASVFPHDFRINHESFYNFSGCSIQFPSFAPHICFCRVFLFCFFCYYIRVYVPYFPFVYHFLYISIFSYTMFNFPRPFRFLFRFSVERNIQQNRYMPCMIAP